MIFEIVGAIAIGAFLAYLAWQIQRVSTRMESMSDSLNARMDELSSSLNARMEEMSNSLNARMNEVSNSLNARMDQIMLDVGEIKGKVGAIEGQITVINHRLDENEKAHAAFAERIDELTATLHK